MYDLKSCPFCGRRMKLVTTKELGVEIQLIGHDDSAQVLCPLMRGILWVGTPEEAISLWNRRAGEDV